MLNFLLTHAVEILATVAVIGLCFLGAYAVIRSGAEYDQRIEANRSKKEGS